ncbi:MAG: hypothetical protein BEN18_03985 [Epulopiscium sp. Nuni2H_MBin001]|nr:MAG: hypothetical protein BEN18_03985 [Epulopiscium sp. Nuni2H_MBin001]
MSTTPKNYSRDFYMYHGKRRSRNYFIFEEFLIKNGFKTLTHTLMSDKNIFNINLKFERGKSDNFKIIYGNTEVFVIAPYFSGLSMEEITGILRFALKKLRLHCQVNVYDDYGYLIKSFYKGRYVRRTLCMISIIVTRISVFN